ncbi:MAG: FHA domain-containing protein [Desulfatitalea sp.]
MTVGGYTRKKYTQVLAVCLWTGLLISIHGSITGVPATHALPDENPPIDLLFVIDNSGSMRKNDPQFITPKVVESFIRQLPAQAQVGMVLFDQTARLLEPLGAQPMGKSQDRFIASLGKIDYKGKFTNSAVGIERALYELKIKGRPEAQRGIVFITDGIVDTGNVQKDQELNQWLKQDLAAQSKSLGVRIFGIAFTEAADYALIQALATRTDGEYYRTYNAAEISTVLDNILIHLTPPAPVAQTPQQAAPAAVATAPGADTPPAQTTMPPGTPAVNAPAREEPVRPVEAKQPPPSGSGHLWFYLILGLIVPILAATAVFFIVVNRKKSVPAVEPRPKQPDAHLEDLDQVLGQGTAVLELTKARTTVGRDARNDLTIPKPTISSFHATIECKNMVFYLEDQRSTNGTKLNDRKLDANMPARLKSGDRISFATFGFKFVIPDQIPFGETIMVSMTALEEPESGSTVIIDLNGEEGEQGLISCMQSHLLQLHAMGQKYREFAGKYFGYEMLAMIAAKAHENLKKTMGSGDQFCGPIVQHKAFYLVCSLPVPVGGAADWYSSRYGGFTQFIMKWLKAPAFQAAQCERLCIITFGQDPATWVSLTIVPTNQEADAVEIMSVDFLNEGEKAMLALDFDHHGRVM